VGASDSDSPCPVVFRDWLISPCLVLFQKDDPFGHHGSLSSGTAILTASFRLDVNLVGHSVLGIAQEC